MAVAEKRTQIYLSGTQHSALRRTAREEGTSMATLVRRAIDAYLVTREKMRPAPPKADPLDDLIGFIEGPGDLSERHDDHLYGRASARRKR